MGGFQWGFDSKKNPKWTSPQFPTVFYCFCKNSELKKNQICHIYLTIKWNLYDNYHVGINLLVLEIILNSKKLKHTKLHNQFWITTWPFGFLNLLSLWFFRLVVLWISAPGLQGSQLGRLRAPSSVEFGRRKKPKSMVFSVHLFFFHVSLWEKPL